MRVDDTQNPHMPEPTYGTGKMKNMRILLRRLCLNSGHFVSKYGESTAMGFHGNSQGTGYKSKNLGVFAPFLYSL